LPVSLRHLMNVSRHRPRFVAAGEALLLVVLIGILVSR
jgi:hypothetical protein